MVQARPLKTIGLIFISIMCTELSCTNNNLISLNDNECYLAKRITVGCPSFAYLQILGNKVGTKWTYDGVVYDNVITVSNYVDSIKTDTIYLTIARSKDWQSCEIQKACHAIITLTRSSGTPYCIKSISSIKCPKPNEN